MKKHLTSFDLRIIAIIFMTFDHVGYFLFPQYRWLRIVGRIAMPIFAFLASESFRHSKNKEMYFLRMIVLGSIFTIVKSYFAVGSTADIFLTLGFGYGILYGIEMKQYYLSAVCLLLGIFLNVDYNWYGMLLVPLFYYLHNKMYLMIPVVYVMTVLAVQNLYFSSIQYYAVISILILLLYNKKPGYKGMKYFFYIYYPLHIIVLNLIEYWR